MTVITDITVRDIRFPTSRGFHGSDAMNPDPDYSAAYVTIHTDRGDGMTGAGFAFTLGRGNELCVASVQALRPALLGRDLDELCADMGGVWRALTRDSQLRWLGPEKGVVHMATAALINALWDLKAKVAEKPLWQLLSDMTPEEIVGCIDFRYITDVVTPDQALDRLRQNLPMRADRIAEICRLGYPAYVTSTGWLGYETDQVQSLSREAEADGWRFFKLKIGADSATDVGRAAAMREAIGEHSELMMDANQVWDVGEAITNIRRLADFHPLWIEEPTSPDDVLGHAAIRSAVSPVGVATGEHCANRVMFKQFFQAAAIDFCQLDACRLAGVNEVLSVLLMAAEFDIPVCPHAGGVGLCEMVQHISLFDYICVSGRLDRRVIEYVDHLHEHFVDPANVQGGRYLAPRAPGYSTTIKPASLARYEYPAGHAWRTSGNAKSVDGPHGA